MSGIEVLKKTKIDKAMQQSKRQYLVGNLALPQELEYLSDDQVEAGITEYQEYTIEKPHYHTVTTEYMFMLEGASKYMDLTSGEEICVAKGDFFLIHSNTTYAQKSKPQTKLLFFKYPAGNDKVVVADNLKTINWYKHW